MITAFHKLTLTASMLALAATCHAEPPKDGVKADTKAAEQAPQAADRASPETKAKFERLKKMAGAWQSGDENKDGQADTRVVYRVTSGGHSVIETLMPGLPHEMVTMYSIDGDSIVATHYCAVGNQPRMRTRGGTASNTIAFDFVDCTNMASPNDGHMHSLVYTFADEDHATASWSFWKDGKPGDHETAFKFERIKDPAAAAKVIESTTGAGTASK